jgi:hypothetical protein
MPQVNVGTSRDALQKAIENAAPWDVLVCPMGAEYGPIQLPPRNLGGVTVECEGFQSRYGKFRRLPSFSGLPLVKSDSVSVWPLQSSPKSGGITFRGINFLSERVDTSDNPSAVVDLGHDAGHLPVKTMEDLPRDITFDRCAIGAKAGSERTQHGLILNAINVAVRGCMIHDIVHGNTESHGIYLDDTPGPVFIEDNEIMASGINILCGGGAPWIPGQMVCREGLFVRRNWLYKLDAWSKRLKEIGCKNLFELKNCWRAVVEWNTLENCWADNQDGHSILFTPREQNPERPSPLTKLGDVMFVRNTIRNVAAGINVSGSDDLGTVSQTEKVTVVGNDFRGLGAYDNAPARAININGIDRTKPIRELNVCGNSFEYVGVGKSLITFQGQPHAVKNLRFESNFYAPTTYGVFATGGRQWANALDDWCQSGNWENNVCVGDPDAMKTWVK